MKRPDIIISLLSNSTFANVVFMVSVYYEAAKQQPGLASNRDSSHVILLGHVVRCVDGIAQPSCQRHQRPLLSTDRQHDHFWSGALNWVHYELVTNQSLLPRREPQEAAACVAHHCAVAFHPRADAAVQVSYHHQHRCVCCLLWSPFFWVDSSKLPWEADHSEGTTLGEEGFPNLLSLPVVLHALHPELSLKMALV